MREHKVLKIALCIIAVIFVANQIYSAAYKPITTVSAESYTAVDGFDINAMIIREEKIITSDTSGALHFVLSDGERVAKDGTIANIYSNADASVAVNRISQLDERINDIEQMQGYNDVEAADITLVNNKINDSLNVMLRNAATGNYSSLEEDASALLNSISRRQMITGEQDNFSEHLSELKAERDALNAALPQPIGSIITDSSGYFVSGLDGYENTLNCEDIGEITPEFLDDLETEDVPKNAIGKIVSGYTWYIAAKVDLSDSLKYKVGDQLVLQTNLKANPELNVTVEKINTSKNGNTAVLVFSCTQMNSELASVRKSSMTIVNNTYTGLKLPTKALRFQDDTTGVFVRSGATLKFVPVNVVYRTDEYIICEKQISNENVLKLYDDVVVKGKGLYDGKYIN